jgi:hypothetical protein
MEVKRKTLVKLKGRYMNLVIAQIWRRRSKRFCGYPGDYSNIYKLRIKNTLTLVGPLINEFYIDNCLRTLKYFLRDNIYNVMAKIKVVEFFHNIEYMQDRIRDQLVKKDAKTEILMNYWDKMFG